MQTICCGLYAGTGCIQLLSQWHNCIMNLRSICMQPLMNDDYGWHMTVATLKEGNSPHQRDRMSVHIILALHRKLCCLPQTLLGSYACWDYPVRTTFMDFLTQADPGGRDYVPKRPTKLWCSAKKDRFLGQIGQLGSEGLAPWPSNQGSGCFWTPLWALSPLELRPSIR